MKYNELLNEKNPQIKIEVLGYGSIIVELFEQIAPITTANFLELVDKCFYDGIIFHRVINGFMIQGGDPLGQGYGGSGKNIKGEFLRNGFNNQLLHSRGVISMARSSHPDSASSQFFIMHEDAPHLDGSYAAFGAVVSGIEIVDKIATTSTDRYDRPLKEVKMSTVRRIR